MPNVLDPAQDVIRDAERAGTSRVARIAMSLGTAVLVATVTAIALDLAARRYVEARALADQRVVSSLACSCGVVASAVAWRSFRSVRSSAWVAFPVLVLPISAFGWLCAMILFRREYGSITSHCGADGFTVDECLERDWSVLQGRHGFRRAEGRIERSRCRAFEAAVLAEPRSPLTADGWVRCPMASPEVWHRWPCEDLGHASMSHCFVCFGRSDTNDDYVYSLGFDASCERGVHTYGVNVDPRDVASCSAAVTENDCPEGWSGRFTEDDEVHP